MYNIYSAYEMPHKKESVMAKKNSTQILGEIITKLDNKIIELQKREYINVTMRIDEVIPFLQEVLALAKDDQSSRKFDLIETKVGDCTIAYTVNGQSVSAGANVLSYGDKLAITVTPSTAYEITSVQVNGKSYTAGTVITVDTDISVVVVATRVLFDLAITGDTHSTIAVTKDGTPISAGTNVLSVGDVITITATADTGYNVSSLKVNGTTIENGSELTVSENISVVSVSALNLYDLTITPAEHSAIIVTRNGDPVTAGIESIAYGDELRVSATVDEGYMVTSLNINGIDYLGDQTITVTSNVTITTTVSIINE